MYRLYAYPTQNSKKVLYVMNEIGVDCELKIVDLFKGEQKAPEFIKMNPIGKVPVLQHNDDYLFESGAICRYIANVENSELYPQDKLQRAKVDQWMDFFSMHLGRWLSALYFQKMLKPKIGQDTDPKACEDAEGFIAEQAPRVDGWLKDHKYFIGDQLSVADLFAFAYVEQMDSCSVSFGPYPNLKRWYEQIEQLESIQKGHKAFDS